VSGKLWHGSLLQSPLEGTEHLLLAGRLKHKANTKIIGIKTLLDKCSGKL
jgi:hypothetical protein